MALDASTTARLKAAGISEEKLGQLAAAVAELNGDLNPYGVHMTVDIGLGDEDERD